MDSALVPYEHISTESISEICQAIWIVSYTYFGFVFVAIGIFILWTLIDRLRKK